MGISSLNVFFFKQKAVYEVRISDWSSDGCSSDLLQRVAIELERERRLAPIVEQCITQARHRRQRQAPRETAPGRDHAPSVQDLGYICGHKPGNVKDRHPWCQTVAPAPSPRAGREFARHDRLGADCGLARRIPALDRKSTRLNSSH